MEQSTWSTVEVARMTGLTSRTLRHYDAIGLVRPAFTGHGGLRHYGGEELLVLQEVLVLRELGLRLDVVAQVLSGQRDRVEALRGHEAALREQAERVARLADTVARTLVHLEGGTTMSDHDRATMFDGARLDADRAAYEEKLVAEHGDGVRAGFRQAEQRTVGWAQEDYADAADRWDALDARYVGLLRQGEPAGGERAQALTAEHHAEIARFWTPDRASCTGLGQTYVDDPRFRQRYDAKDPALAVYLRDAIAAYAERELA